MILRIIKNWIAVCFVLVLVVCKPAQALIEIEIREGIEAALPIAIVPFGEVGLPVSPPEDIASIITADLKNSGRFAPLPTTDFLGRPHELGQVRYQDWRMLGVENLVIGKIHALGGNRFRVEFRLLDVFKGIQLTGYSYNVVGKELRRVAHKISDIIYESLTGEPGAFDTRIAYVSLERFAGGNARYILHVADSDGHNDSAAVVSSHPIMSPSWSPDGTRLAYVSFESGSSEIYVLNLRQGRRELVASHSGINSAPSWSPDGRSLALVLSKDGNPEIYVLNLSNKKLKRLTFNYAIDTEPTWFPDGETILFTSDRGGKPQLYRAHIHNARASRVTFEGGYNAAGDVSPDGKMITFVHRVGGEFRIAVKPVGRGQTKIISNSLHGESPSFAPNGSMVVYSSEQGFKGSLTAVSVDGRIRQRIVLPQSDAREPAWGPYSSHSR